METETITLLSNSDSKNSDSRSESRKHRHRTKNKKYDALNIINHCTKPNYYSVSDTYKFKSMVLPVSNMPDALPTFIIKIRKLDFGGNMIYFQTPLLTGKLGLDTDHVYLSQSISGAPDLEISSSLIVYYNNQPSMGSVIIKPFSDETVKFYFTADRTKLSAGTEFIIPAISLSWYSN